MKQSDRRNFLKILYGVPFVGVFACNSQGNNTENLQQSNLMADPRAMALSMKMSKEQLFTMLDGRVALIMQKSHNCAQSSFYALSEQFGLGGNDVLKALTPLPGIAERGETCGAITGSLMAMGLVFGRDKLDDWKTYRASLVPTNKFCAQFTEEMGTNQCCQIQEKAFGRSFNLMDPDDLRAFQKAGATTKCTKVVQKACKLAAELILDSDYKPDA